MTHGGSKMPCGALTLASPTRALLVTPVFWQSQFTIFAGTLRRRDGARRRRYHGVGICDERFLRNALV
jgi:hypothetical protein